MNFSWLIFTSFKSIWWQSDAVHNGENACDGPPKNKERLIVKQSTRRRTAQDLNLHQHCCDNLEYRKYKFTLLTVVYRVVQKALETALPLLQHRMSRAFWDTLTLRISDYWTGEEVAGKHKKAWRLVEEG